MKRLVTFKPLPEHLVFADEITTVSGSTYALFYSLSDIGAFRDTPDTKDFLLGRKKPFVTNSKADAQIARKLGVSVDELVFEMRRRVTMRLVSRLRFQFGDVADEISKYLEAGANELHPKDLVHADLTNGLREHLGQDAEWQSRNLVVLALAEELNSIQGRVDFEPSVNIPDATPESLRDRYKKFVAPDQDGRLPGIIEVALRAIPRIDLSDLTWDQAIEFHKRDGRSRELADIHAAIAKRIADKRLIKPGEILDEAKRAIEQQQMLADRWGVRVVSSVSSATIDTFKESRLWDLALLALGAELVDKNDQVDVEAWSDRIEQAFDLEWLPPDVLWGAASTLALAKLTSCGYSIYKKTRETMTTSDRCFRYISRIERDF